jgi:hypothetical protein
MQRDAPTVYFDHVIHKPPIRTPKRSLIVSCIRRVSGPQSVIEGRGGTIKLYPMGAKVWRLAGRAAHWTGCGGDKPADWRCGETIAPQFGHAAVRGRS